MQPTDEATRQSFTTRPPVRGVPMVSGKTAEPAQGKSRAVALFALVIGAPFWFEAARFTRDGWIIFLNWFCERMAIPWRVPPLSWQAALAVLIMLGVGYSYVEMVRQPVRLPRSLRRDFFDLSKWQIERRWEVWAVWAVLVISDVGTTYIGARQPDPSGLAIMRDIAARATVLAVYAILITFLPDRLIRYGWRTLRG